MLVDARVVQAHGHLFASLPLVRRTNGADSHAWQPYVTDAVAGEEAGLLDEATTPKRHRTRMNMWREGALAAVATACACLAVVMVLIISLAYRRFSVTMQGVSDHVDVISTTSNVIRNVDGIINSTAQVAAIVHQLGLKGIDASYFSKPFLTRLLNTTTMIAEDTHRVLEHPKISIG